MRREIRIVDAERGWVQVTSCDERWYFRTVNRESGDPFMDVVPSVSWVSGYYPKSVEFYKWLAKTGWSEAEEIKATAGDKGTKVHQAISRLVSGGTVGMGDLFENPRTFLLEPLTDSEYFCLMTFAEWFEKTRPEVLRTEYTVWNERYRYAGTVDLLLRIGAQVWLIDIKTSAQVWPSMELQVSAYKHADPTLPKNVKLAILQVGYKYNKKQKYKFTPVTDQFPLFLATRKIWARETAGTVPFQRDYPLSLSLSPELTLKEVAA